MICSQDPSRDLDLILRKAFFKNPQTHTFENLKKKSPKKICFKNDYSEVRNFELNKLFENIVKFNLYFTVSYEKV